MKLVEMKCKNCGAKLKVDSEVKEANCQFCGAEFKIDDEVQHVKYDDMEQAGYDFEKGKLRAQEEHRQNNYQNVSSSKPNKNNKTKWLILGWIFLFPFMATYYVLKSDKLDQKKKIIIVIAMWIIFIIIGIVGNIQEEEDKKNKIIECYSLETYNKLDELIGIDKVEGDFSDDYSCDNLDITNQYNKKINIQMNDNKLISIKLDDKFIYNIDESVEIYDPTTLRVKPRK